MKVMILGYGNVGRVLAALLEKEPAITSITCCDLSLNEDQKSGKIALRKADMANKGELSSIISQVNPGIVVNAALPIFNTQIMECCLQSKAHYLDAASYWGEDNSPNPISPYKVEQLDFNEQFRQNGLIGLINAGVSPGLTNLLAKESTKGFDEVDSIKIRLLEETKVNKAVFSWCKEWLIDEITCKPLIYAGNKFQLIDSHSDEEYDFPEPFGKRKVAHIAQDEVGTIPLYLKVKNVDIKAYDDQVELIKEEMKRSKKKEDGGEGSNMQLNSNEAIDIRSIEEAQFGIVVETSGKEKNSDKVMKQFVAFPKQKDINSMGLNANFITYPTALMMKAFILALAKVKRFGVFPPEALNREAADTILADIKSSGINVLKTEIVF